MKGKTKTIVQKVFLPARPAEVYDALINAEKHAAFTGATATCDPRVGGKFTAWGGYITGKNLKLEKGRRIVQEWKTTEWSNGFPASIVEFSFQEKEDGAELTMVHAKVPADQAEEYRLGWQEYYWKPLRKYFERR